MRRNAILDFAKIMVNNYIIIIIVTFIFAYLSSVHAREYYEF